MRPEKKEKKEEKRISTSCYKGFVLAEEIYDQELDPRFQFCYLDPAKNEEPTIQPTVETPAGLIYPLDDDNIIKGTVLLPSGFTEYGSQQELLARIRAFIHKYVDMPLPFEVIAAHYILLTWVYEDFDALPYLCVQGDPGSGKSRFLRTIGSLCYKSISSGGAVNAAPIYRFIEAYHGTMVTDESDFKHSDLTQDIVKILNCGFTKGSPVLRCEGSDGGAYLPKSYDCFSPKILAHRYDFADLALRSRCLTHQMQKRSRQDIPINLPEKEFHAEAVKIRNMLLLWRLRNLGKIIVRKNLPTAGIEDRIVQILAPLASVMDDENAEFFFTDFVPAYNKKFIEDRGYTNEAEIVDVVYSFWQEKNVYPTLKEIVKEYENKYGSEAGDKKLSPRRVGTIVRKGLGLKTERRSDGYAICDSDENDIQMEAMAKKYGFIQESGE